MSPRLRKLIGSLTILVWMVVYIAVAAVIGDRVSSEHWVWKLIYFPVAGVLWVFPLRPLMRWMHAKDPPAQNPNV